VAYFVLGMAPSYPVVLIAAALVGVSISLWHPPALSTLSAQLRDRLGLALSVHGMGGEIGNTIGPLGLGILIGAVTWRTASQMMALPIVFLALLLWLVLRNVPGREGGKVGGRQYVAAIKALARNRLALGIVLSRGVLTLGTAGIFAFFSLYLQRDLGFDVTTASLYYAALMASGIVSQPIMGYLSDQYGRRAVIVPSVMLLGLFMMSLRWAGSGPWLLVVSIGIGLFIYSIGAILQAAAMEATDEKTGALTVSMLFASSSLFGIPAPTIAGTISAAHGTTAVFLYSGVMIVIAAFFFWWRLPARPVRSVPRARH
jgi:FSR family fosmidomycin resistance protein-like MFS transporter